MSAKDIRPGEITLPFDPADRTDRAVWFIGHLRTPWRKDDCPKNIRMAREWLAARGGTCELHLADGLAPALTGLAVGQPVILLYWMDDARRDLVLQAPRHTDGPRGTFALRSPARPNPIALSTVRLTRIDAARGVLGLDAIDAFDGTPVVDLKPWLPTVDQPPID